MGKQEIAEIYLARELYGKRWKSVERVCKKKLEK
jgi:hypothetical protein